MAAHVGRRAQDWARAFAEGIEMRIARESEGGKNIGDVLPIYLEELGQLPRGQAIRYCQEINMAKKQADAHEHAKQADSRILITQRLTAGLECGPEYKPSIVAWVLKAEPVAVHAAISPKKTDLMILYAGQPTGRLRSKGVMFEKAMEFLTRQGEHAIPKAKVDPFAEYYAMASPPVGAPAPQVAEDKQEDLLASLYNLTPEGD